MDIHEPRRFVGVRLAQRTGVRDGLGERGKANVQILVAAAHATAELGYERVPIVDWAAEQMRNYWEV